MSLPRIATKIVFTGSKILGRAMAEAGRQAMANAKHRPESAEAAASSSGSGPASARSLNSDLKMTLEEAQLILNVKKDDPMDVIEKNYERIFAANSPPAPAAEKTPAPPQQGAAAARSARAQAKSKVTGHSHYLQSKVYRALERIKAERAGTEGEGTEGTAAAAGESSTEATASESATTAEAQAPPPPPPSEEPPKPKEPAKEPRTAKEGETISL